MAEEKTSEKAAEVSETGNGKVTVVCTPTGGAKTVRLKLPVTWEEEMTDDALLDAIQHASN